MISSKKTAEARPCVGKKEAAHLAAPGGPFDGDGSCRAGCPAGSAPLPAGDRPGVRTGPHRPAHRPAYLRIREGRRTAGGGGAEGPDVVLLGGDIVDDDARMDPERAYTAASALAASWPTYYVSGNHEFWSGEADAIKTALEARGVTVLEGACVPVAVDGQTIQLCGMDDPAAGRRLARPACAGRGAGRSRPFHHTADPPPRAGGGIPGAGLRPDPGGPRPWRPVAAAWGGQRPARAGSGPVSPIRGRAV